MSNKPTNFPNGVRSAQGFTGPVNGAVGGTTPEAGAFTTLTTSGAVTLGDAGADAVQINGTVTILLASIPEYADQATAAAALAPGALFRITTTGALAVALT